MSVNTKNQCFEKDVPIWEMILRHVDALGFPSDESLITLLYAHGMRFFDSQGRVPTDMLSRQWREAEIEWFVGLLSASSYCRVYLKSDGFIVVRHDKPHALVFEHGKPPRTELRRTDVAFSALFAWRYLFPREGYKEAGAFVSLCAEHCVAEVRRKAEADFDAAVAVSPKGQIVRADTVWVMNTSGWITPYPAARFLGNKIFLEEERKACKATRISTVRGANDWATRDLLWGMGFQRDNFSYTVLRNRLKSFQ